MSMDIGSKVENANLAKVLYFIDKMLAERPGHCRCHKCRLDTAAIALNMLPPHYYADPANVRKYDLGSPWLLIEKAVADAMDRVNAYPRHFTDVQLNKEVPAPIYPLHDAGTDS